MGASLRRARAGTCRRRSSPRRYAGRPYDAEVAWTDALVGRFVESLRTTGRLDDTLVIVTSDHGEGLGDHGEETHGYFVYESTLRVPLVLRGPGVKAGTRLDGVARTIDLLPTILQLTASPPPVGRPSPAAASRLPCAARGGCRTIPRSPNRCCR